MKMDWNVLDAVHSAELLIKNGAHIDAENLDGETPLEVAIDESKTKINATNSFISIEHITLNCKIIHF